ncbi:MAG: hypothetical protein J4G11_07875 [Acidimicrobiia bacterium]|nr:hypothetical protein [Acidimicrobiia bacterium]
MSGWTELPLHSQPSARYLVTVVLVAVALMGIVDVALFVAMVLVRVALVFTMRVVIGMMLVVVALVRVVDVALFVAVMLVRVAPIRVSFRTDRYSARRDLTVG